MDDHIEMWVKAKENGTSGVPSIRRLVEDAEDISEMLKELAEATLPPQRTIGEQIAEYRKGDAR